MIRDFISSYFKDKVKNLPTLVIYDPDRQYHSIITSMDDQNIRVFDFCSNVLSIREDAIEYYAGTIAKDTNSRMIVYVPFTAPLHQQDKLMDPFYIFAMGGSLFPYGAEDKYESLCKACFPDKEQQINALFMQETPAFDTIDALAGGQTWAKLQTLTGGVSEKEILLAILAPTEKQKERLTKDKTWYTEYKSLISTIGLDTKEKSFESVEKELWRFILFSEFVFDLPIALPSSLKNITVAKPSAKTLILEICKSLRKDKTCEELYIQRADEVAHQLGLPEIFRNENELGEIITFSFEDNTYFYHFFSLLQEGKNGEAKGIIERIRENIWLHNDEERRRYWKMAELGLEIIAASAEKVKTSSTLKNAIDLYITTHYKTDQLQRRFEKLATEVMEENRVLAELKSMVRKAYNQHSEKYQKQYQQLVQTEHWPAEGFLHNNKVFSKHVTHLLKAKSKAAYILVDALRFELAKELEDNISKYFSVQVLPSCAYLPTVTKYGMAALLPDADKHLTLRDNNGSLEAFMEDKILCTLAQRRNYIKDKLGDRCEITTLEKLVANNIPDADLLIVTTNEIDNAGENVVNQALSVMQQALQNLVKGLNHLKRKGYEKVIIATDHGFVLHPEFQAGDNVTKPVGEWIMAKSRSCAGSGATPTYGMGFSPEEIGVKSEVKNFVFLKNYAVFERNTTYFHEGISLQENIVPVMILTSIKKITEKKIQVNLTYKGQTTGYITTRRPSLEISCYVEGELGLEPISVRMEAIANDNTIGKPGSDEHVNEVSNLVEIIPGQAYKIPIDMEAEFEGKFEVRITDPVTNKTYATISLETDYIS